MPLYRKQPSPGQPGQGGGEPVPPSFDRTNIADQILLDCPEVYFRFDEAVGTVAVDHSGFNRNGTYGATAQLGRAALADTVRSVYNPQLQFSHPITQRQDFSAIVVVRMTTETTNGVFFLIGNNQTGITVGKGSSDPTQAGNYLTSVINNVQFVSSNAQLSPGTNLVGISVRSRDNQILYFLNGVPVHVGYSNYITQVGGGTVGSYTGLEYPALCEYGEFALFGCELSPSRFAAYWKAVQLSS